MTTRCFLDPYNPGHMHGYHEGNSQWDLLWSYKPSLDKIMITESLPAIVCFHLSAEISATKGLSSVQASDNLSKRQHHYCSCFFFSILILSCHKMRISNWVTRLLCVKLASLLAKSLCFSPTSLSRPKKACLKARLFSNLQLSHVSLSGLRNTGYLHQEHMCCLHSELQLSFAK